jgi:hypothetical protein
VVTGKEAERGGDLDLHGIENGSRHGTQAVDSSVVGLDHHVVLQVEDDAHAGDDQEDHPGDHGAGVALALGALGSGEVEDLLAVDVRDGLLSDEVQPLLGDFFELRHSYRQQRGGGRRDESRHRYGEDRYVPHSMAFVASVRFQYSSISCAQKATKVQNAGTV